MDFGLSNKSSSITLSAVALAKRTQPDAATSSTINCTLVPFQDFDFTLPTREVDFGLSNKSSSIPPSVVALVKRTQPDTATSSTMNCTFAPFQDFDFTLLIREVDFRLSNKSSSIALSAVALAKRTQPDAATSSTINYTLVPFGFRFHLT